MTESLQELVDLSLFELTADDGSSELSFAMAAAILMFEVINADGTRDDIEVAELVEILKTQFGLRSKEVTDVFKKVHAVPQDDFRLSNYTALFVEHWGYKKRLRLLEDFWLIALANSEIERDETEMIDTLALMLELKEEDMDKVQRNAEQKIELNLS